MFESAPPKIDILQRLRGATVRAHRKLETDLDLLAEPLDRARFVRVLERFRGFHAVWEEALGGHRALEATARPRRRLNLLDRDLAALGRSAGEIAAAPPCPSAAKLTDTAERALGSLYVLEGSTLGGKLISKALAGAPWTPAGGLKYFDPYGAQTGMMWRNFQDMLRQASSAETDPGIERGAQDTFGLLQSWLVEA